MEELKKLWDKAFSYYYEKAKEEIGEYSHDEEAYGDSYISTGEYLINEDEVSDRAWELFDEDFSDYLEEAFYLKMLLAEEFMPKFDKTISWSKSKVNIINWQPDFKSIKEKMEK